MKHFIIYDEETQAEAKLFLYRLDRSEINLISDEEGCGAVFVLICPPY